jgi:hypothetical protein
MDFVVGILLMIIIILILYNFASVSISSSNTNSSKNCNSNSNMNTNTTQYNSIPSPVLSKSPSAINNKVNLNVQAYDYKKYFFA